MSLYRYQSNVDAADRATRLTILLDNGKSLTMDMGGTYDLTANELARASQRVVMVSSSAPDQSQTVRYLPVIGNLSNGQVPIWNSALGAFVPGTISGGGSGNVDAVKFDGTWPTRPAAAVVFWIGGDASTDSPAVLMEIGDIWYPASE